MKLAALMNDLGQAPQKQLIQKVKSKISNSYCQLSKQTTVTDNFILESDKIKELVRTISNRAGVIKTTILRFLNDGKLHIQNKYANNLDPNAITERIVKRYDKNNHLLSRVKEFESKDERGVYKMAEETQFALHSEKPKMLKQIKIYTDGTQETSISRFDKDGICYRTTEYKGEEIKSTLFKKDGTVLSKRTY